MGGFLKNLKMTLESALCTVLNYNVVSAMAYLNMYMYYDY